MDEDGRLCRHHRLRLQPLLRTMDDFVWHWYILNGYEEFEDTFMVKAVTYGTWRWLDLKMLWTTGHQRKGGLILFS